jgi:sRNA-binding carbon storage regulator CsrA
MKKKISVLLVFVLVVALVLVGVTSKERAYAKTAQMYMELPDSVKKENEFTVRVVLESDVDLYSVDAYLTYNPEMIEFVPDGDYVTGSAGVLELKDIYAEETKNAEYELTFRALDTGKTELALSEVYLIDYADMDYIEVVPSAKQFDIKVNKTVATDARLSDLLVAPGELTEEFQPDQLDYEMHVGLDVEMVGVSATPMDEDSVVFTDMPDKLQVGENVITITVTAISGNVNVYTVKVYREELTEEVTEEQKTATEGSEAEEEQNAVVTTTEKQDVTTEDVSVGEKQNVTTELSEMVDEKATEELNTEE